MATGMTGTSASSAILATPVFPLYSLPSGERVPAEEPALAQQPDRGVQRGLCRRTAGAVDRELPDPGEEPFLQPALESLFGEIFLFRRKGDHAFDVNGHEKRIRDGEVIAGENRATRVGNVFQPGHLGRPQQPEQGAD
jgi:hypothetical protein